MMRKYRLVLLFIPWMLLLLTLLLWSLGVKMPSFNRNITEVQQALVIVEKVEELGRLELVRYNFKEIYDYFSLSEGKIKGNTALKVYDYAPDLKVVLIASGEAVGCIDLRDMDNEYIQIKKDTLFFRIPEPEICYHKLDHEHTRVYDFERSGFWSNIFPDDSEVSRTIDKAYAEAERQILKSALENGILEQTAHNAEIILKPLLEKISGKAVVFTYAPGKEKLSTPE